MERGGRQPGPIAVDPPRRNAISSCTSFSGSTGRRKTAMGLFWELIEQGQIMSQGSRTLSLEQRVANLEQQLRSTQILLQKTLEVLEKYTGKDIDGNGSVG
jgi:hypothetical protein